MPASAIAMLVFGCVVLYGGFAYFLHVALKHRRDKTGEQSE